jgi:CBS domain-containing protein
MSGGNAVGIITERDIVGKVIRERGDVSKIRAQEIMSSPLVTVDSGRSVAEALELIRDKKQEIRRLAVTRQGRLVGIVTEEGFSTH